MQKLSSRESVEPQSTVDTDKTEQSDLSNTSHNLVEESMATVSADMEFISLLELLLHEDAVLTMADLH